MCCPWMGTPTPVDVEGRTIFFKVAPTKLISMEPKHKGAYDGTDWKLAVSAKNVATMVDQSVKQQGGVIEDAVQRIDMQHLSETVARVVREKVGSAVQQRMSEEVEELATQAAAAASAQLVAGNGKFTTPAKGNNNQGNGISPADIEKLCRNGTAPSSPKRPREEEEAKD